MLKVRSKREDEYKVSHVDILSSGSRTQGLSYTPWFWEQPNRTFIWYSVLIWKQTISGGRVEMVHFMISRKFRFEFTVKEVFWRGLYLKVT